MTEPDDRRRSLESFDVVRGLDLDWFLDHGLRAPGGEQPITGRRELGDGRVRLSHPPVPGPRTGDRWQRAQVSEGRFWQGWRRPPVYRATDLRGYWQRMIDFSGGAMAPGRILDVGCGPVSLLRFHRPAGARVFGVDPLATWYRDQGLLECDESLGPIAMAACPAEALPFADRTFDTILSINMLDHCAHPGAVLAEMMRVLAAGGCLRLVIYTFPFWLRPLLAGDPTHPYHWTANQVGDLVVSAGFEIRSRRLEPRRFQVPPDERWWRWLRYRAAGRLVKVLALELIRTEAAR